MCRSLDRMPPIVIDDSHIEDDSPIKIAGTNIISEFSSDFDIADDWAKNFNDTMASAMDATLVQYEAKKNKTISIQNVMVTKDKEIRDSPYIFVNDKAAVNKIQGTHTGTGILNQECPSKPCPCSQRNRRKARRKGVPAC